jgi:phage terminase large subunit
VQGALRKLEAIIDYAPRRQFLSFHRRKQRWAILVCHRRAGKTVATLNDLIRAACSERKPDGRYAFVAPYYNQAKDIAWTYLKYYAEPLLAETPREAELSVLLRNGARIRLYGADNPDRLRGIYLDGVVLDEFGDMMPSLWTDVVRPALSDRKGWAIFIGTPKGKNAFWQLWAGDQKGWPGAINQPDWFTLMLKASQTGLIDASELADARKQMGEDQYAQEYECSFEAAIKGAFYADELRIMQAEGRIRPIEIVKDIRVHTGWDIGRTDSTAIWFIQCVGRERRLVDYYEQSGKIITYYADVLLDKKREHGWQYGEHFGPHDMAFHMLDAEKSRRDMMLARGVDFQIVPAHDVLEGVNVTRKMLGRAWIDSVRCERGLEALRQYRRAWDDKLNDWKPSEFKDWTNHGADALRTFAAGYDDPTALTPRGDRHRTRNDGGGATSWAA